MIFDFSYLLNFLIYDCEIVHISISSCRFNWHSSSVFWYMSFCQGLHVALVISTLSIGTCWYLDSLELYVTFGYSSSLIDSIASLISSSFHLTSLIYTDTFSFNLSSNSIESTSSIICDVCQEYPSSNISSKFDGSILCLVYLEDFSWITISSPKLSIQSSSQSICSGRTTTNADSSFKLELNFFTRACSNTVVAASAFHSSSLLYFSC